MGANRRGVRMNRVGELARFAAVVLPLSAQSKAKLTNQAKQFLALQGQRPLPLVPDDQLPPVARKCQKGSEA